jgi:hypothetical protein
MYNIMNIENGNKNRRKPLIYLMEKIPLKNLKSLLSDKHSDNLQEKKNKPLLPGPK